RQDFARSRVEGNDRAWSRAEGLLRHCLQGVIDAELNLLTGDGFQSRQSIDFLADAVNDDPAHAVGPLKHVVILAFQPSFADKVAGTKLTVAVFDLLFADLADITAGVGHEAVWQVAPAMNHQHFKLRDVGAVCFPEGDVPRGSFRLDDDGLKSGQLARVVELVSKVAYG